MNISNCVLLAATVAILAACGGGGGGDGSSSSSSSSSASSSAGGGGAGAGVNGASQTQSYAPTTVSANVSDNVGVVRVKFLLNGSVMCDLPTSSQQNALQTYSCQVTPVQGANVITVQAIDAAGNVGAATVTAQGQ
jgi:hypothetical protein